MRAWELAHLSGKLTRLIQFALIPGRELVGRANPESCGTALSEIPGSRAAKLLAPRNDSMFLLKMQRC